MTRPDPSTPHDMNQLEYLGAVRHHDDPSCGCSADGRQLCFKHKLRTIQMSPKVRSSQSQMEKRWERDMPAYQRLRMNGLQPKQIDGCGDLETRASTQMEVEMGLLLGPDAKKALPQVAEGMAMAREMEWTPKDSVEDMKNKTNRKVEA